MATESAAAFSPGREIKRPDNLFTTPDRSACSGALPESQTHRARTVTEDRFLCNPHYYRWFRAARGAEEEQNLSRNGESISTHAA